MGCYDQHEEGKMGYFSVQGHRSPLTEGRPGSHYKILAEIIETYKTKKLLRD